MRDRVKELRRVRAGDLRPHPMNWRKHPDDQRSALRAALNEVGFAGALLARELPDGALELIDGHLRAETATDQIVPVLVLDVSAEEADKILLTHDPLAAMAEVDAERLAALVEKAEFEHVELEELLTSAAQAAASAEPAIEEVALWPEVVIPESFQVVVQCDGEDQQRAVYERMRGEGFRCRVLTL